MAKKQKSNKISSNVPHWVEAFVVEVSLQNPDYGPQRLLPFLEQEGITLTASAVYSILRRNNLQNRTLRLSKLEEQRTAEIVPEPADTIEEPAEELESVPAHTIETRPESTGSPAVKSLSKFTGRHLCSYTLPSLWSSYWWLTFVSQLWRISSEPGANLFSHRSPQQQSPPRKLKPRSVHSKITISSMSATCSELLMCKSLFHRRRSLSRTYPLLTRD
jgi:hypothetical protein